jgi:hypothetical protein
MQLGGHTVKVWIGAPGDVPEKLRIDCGKSPGRVGITHRPMMRSSADQVTVQRVAHELRPRPRPELVMDVRAVRLDRTPREVERVGDLGGRVSERDQPQDLDLARGQSVLAGASAQRIEARGDAGTDVLAARRRRPDRLRQLVVGPVL